VAKLPYIVTKRSQMGLSYRATAAVLDWLLRMEKSKRDATLFTFAFVAAVLIVGLFESWGPR
jgi:hypothetical protein